jgi:hypothetical protein
VALRYGRQLTPVNMVNAFEQPVQRSQKGLSGASVERLNRYWMKMEEFYGQKSETLFWDMSGGFEQGTAVTSLGGMLEQMVHWLK